MSHVDIIYLACRGKSMQVFLYLGLNSSSLCLFLIWENSDSCRKLGNVAKFVDMQHGLKNCKILYYYLKKPD